VRVDCSPSLTSPAGSRPGVQVDGARMQFACTARDQPPRLPRRER
jgi:hypothetical protein